MPEPQSEGKKRAARCPAGRHPVSEWWVLVEREDPEAKVLVADRGEWVLPVFCGEAEAEMFVWLGGASGDGWRVRNASAGELVSVLGDPRARVRRVALDPSPEMVETDALGLVSVTPERFLSWVGGRGNILPGGRAHTTALGEL